MNMLHKDVRLYSCILFHYMYLPGCPVGVHTIALSYPGGGSRVRKMVGGWNLICWIPCPLRIHELQCLDISTASCVGYLLKSWGMEMLESWRCTRIHDSDLDKFVKWFKCLIRFIVSCGAYAGRVWFDPWLSPLPVSWAPHHEYCLDAIVFIPNRPLK